MHGHDPKHGKAHAHGGAGGHGAMMEMVRRLPAGVASPSGHYWCAMCKKMFELTEPVCPYMPDMCVNTPIAIETLPPGSAAFYERIGLFYPKFVQRLLASAVARAADPEPLGTAFADDYLADLAEWRVQHQASPLEAVKAFLIYTAGFDVVTRSAADGFTLYLMDAGAVWGEELPAKVRSRTALLAGARRVAKAIGLEAPLELHFMSVAAGEMGRYHCAPCSMFFEYGAPQAQVTCPFMPQKCGFRPKPIAELVDLASPKDGGPGRRFGLGALTRIYAVSPKLHRRQLQSAMSRGFEPAVAREAMTADLTRWGFDVADGAALAALWKVLGLA